MARNPAWPERFADHEYPQKIPDPDEILPGAPAPWSQLPETNLRGFTLSMVLDALERAGRSLATSTFPSAPSELAQVHDAIANDVTGVSAVLVALFEDHGETHVVLTRRARTLRSHRGEVAFPGGRSEENETPVQTALREASEEVGINPVEVTVVGWLSPIVTFASGSAIWPVVGVLKNPPAMVVNPSEVERAFSVALRDLVAAGNFLEERWRRSTPRPGADSDGFFPLYFFRVPDDVIWGATARVLTELLCAVTSVPWPDANRVWA